MSAINYNEILFNQAKLAYQKKTYLEEFELDLKSLKKPENGVNFDARLFLFTIKKVIATRLQITDLNIIDKLYNDFKDKYLYVKKDMLMFNLFWGKGFSEKPYRSERLIFREEKEEVWTDI